MSEIDIGELWFNGVSIKRKDTVVEIGAFSGSISLYAADEFGVERIYAIEASKKNFKLTCEKCKGSPVRPMNLAIGEKDGGVSFIEYENLPSSSSLIQSDARYSPDVIVDSDKGAKPVRTEVRSLTLASFLNETDIENIDLLIMNCEGAEQFILPQIVEKLEMIGRTKEISIEFHPTLLGQGQVMRLIMLLAPYYRPRIVTRSLRGLLNIVFFPKGVKRESSAILASSIPTCLFHGRDMACSRNGKEIQGQTDTQELAFALIGMVACTYAMKKNRA